MTTVFHELAARKESHSSLTLWRNCQRTPFLHVSRVGSRGELVGLVLRYHVCVTRVSLSAVGSHPTAILFGHRCTVGVLLGPAGVTS